MCLSVSLSLCARAFPYDQEAMRELLSSIKPADFVPPENDSSQDTEVVVSEIHAFRCEHMDTRFSFCSFPALLPGLFFGLSAPLN